MANLKRSNVRLRRRTILLGAATAAFASPALGQSFPASPIRLVVPYSPGGGADTTAPLIPPKLQEVFGDTAVVGNRPGAVGSIRADLCPKSSPYRTTLPLR